MFYHALPCFTMYINLETVGPHHDQSYIGHLRSSELPSCGWFHHHSSDIGSQSGFPIYISHIKKNIFLCLIFSHHGKCPIYFPYMSYVPFYISHIFPIYFPYIFLQIGSFFCWPHDLRHPDAVLGAMLKLTFIPTARSCGVYSIVLGVQIGKIKFERINL